mgnify:CR=1 FL=1
MKLICDKGDEFRIGGFSFGIGNRVSEKSLEGIQISAIPGYFDGMADGTLHSGRGGLECLGDLRIQYFCDGIHGLVSPLERLPEVGNWEGFLWRIDSLVRCPVFSCFIGLVALL